MAVYTVTQVTSYIRQSLEADPLLADLWVVGEVSNLRVSAAGHTYFSLKDRDSLLRGVMFKSRPGAELLADGASISAHGRVSFYERGGTTDFQVDIAMPEGLGELALELERLKRKLEAEGLFEPSRKRALPQFPQAVGVVTSSSGSVFHDIQNVMRRRYPLARLVLSPTVVQGETAAAKIAAALALLDEEGGCDVIILARGGGSLEDLWPFNEEVVARAIHACRTPVISAIGHETDETISDYVADVRAPTPSVAAELAVPDQRVLRQALARVTDALYRELLGQVDQHRTRVERTQRQMESGLPDIMTWRRRVDDVGRVAQAAVGKLMGESRMQVDGVFQRLRGLDPLATLERGFSIAELQSTGEVITSKSQVNAGDAIKITVSDGPVPAVASGGASYGKAARKKAKAPPQQQMTPLL